MESLKVQSSTDSFKVEERSPRIYGTVPRRVFAEVRRAASKAEKIAITYWYYWGYDLYFGDHEDWEPVSLVYNRDELIEVYARVHDALVRYHPSHQGKPQVYFIKYGHTPAVRVSNQKTDARLQKLNDRSDSTRQKWLDLCYRRANSNGWSLANQPPIVETTNGPILDQTHWKTWGKHSVYLRI